MMRRRLVVMVTLLLVVVLRLPASAQEAVPSPSDAFGFPIGADYRLVTYEQLASYWAELARLSPRMTLDTIGTTSEGRPQLMAVITSPENQRNLDRYRTISARLTRARGVSEEEARRLAGEGRTVVWIDGGLHATEVLGSQQLVELVYRMVSDDDPETLRILDHVILLAAHANPDGHQLVADWYMRRQEPASRSLYGLPVLYQKYAGHDDNRDFYMSNLDETRNMNRVLYRDWYPQIVYDHHQTGPAGAIMFAPPFRDPANHYIDPLVLTGVAEVGAAMHNRFVAEGKGGTTMRSGGTYSTWWDGGLRTTPYFHNMIGLLTETQGSPNPIRIPFVPERQRSTNTDLPLPVEPTSTWHFRQSIEYSQTANRAVLDYAARNHDALLMDAWRMGHRAIEAGDTDSWTVLPKDVARAAEILGGPDARAGRDEWRELLHPPDHRDPRGYILPAGQPDFNTATKFMNALLENGVEVLRATADFRVDGTSYPAGSWVVRTDQAFRAFVLDMFEPQDYPNDFAYPGGPPIPPYDIAGWTLAYQMGVRFDRILNDFDGPFEPVEKEAAPLSGEVTGPGHPAGWVLDHRVNDTFTAVNRLLAGGVSVYWLEDSVRAGGRTLGPGAFWVPAEKGAAPAVREAARAADVRATGVSRRPGGRALRLSPVRIGLWDEYGGSVPSGWTRFVLERFGFDFSLVFPKELDEGNLREKYDVLIFPDEAIPGPDGSGNGNYQPPESSVPPRWRDRLGRVTVSRTVPRILEFLREGGTVIAEGSSTVLGREAGLPVRSWLVDASGEPLTAEEFYVPGSVLGMAVDHDTPATDGLGGRVSVLFDRSPVFGLLPGADEKGVRPLAHFATDAPLESGWAWGQRYLEGGTPLLEAPVGHGRLFLFGPDVTFRGQTHGAFPFLFNAALRGGGEEVSQVP